MTTQNEASAAREAEKPNPAPAPPPAGKKRLRTVVLSVLALALLAFTARALVKAGAKVAPRPETVPVSAALVGRQTVPIQVKAIGNVEAYNAVAVRSVVAGELTRIHFRQGQEVRKGDLLFTIDQRPLKSALDQAEGTLAKDKAQLENAKVLAVRYQKLFEDGISSKELADQNRTAADTFAAAVRADEAAVENARVQLSYATIRSPIAGLAGNLVVYEGNLVKANDTTPLVTIAQSSPVYVTFSVPEQELSRINRYRAANTLRADAAAPGDEARPLSGDLTFVDNMVDTTTGTIKLKATFANREKRLWPGQFVKVTLTLAEQPDAVVVPSQAVQIGQDGPYVYIVRTDLTAEPRPVKIGPAAEGVSVVTAGLEPGERVVTDGQLRLFPGAKVELKTEGTPSPRPTR
jgi:multidrug efflux system membrane fusion protein